MKHAAGQVGFFVAIKHHELQVPGTQGIMQVVCKNYVNLTETDESRLKTTLEAFED
jgi:hypothetical protein